MKTVAPPRVQPAEPPDDVADLESLPDETSAPMSTEDVGTLVAIAIGGSCHFYVDGASQATSSSIRIKVAVGRHTVRCEREGAPPRNRTQIVEVSRTKPGIASFRID